MSNMSTASTNSNVSSSSSIASNTSSPSSVILEASLKKKSPSILKSWQSRHCRLTKENFSYFKKKEDTEPAGQIPLHLITAVTHVIDPKTKRKSIRFDVTVGTSGNGSSGGNGIIEMPMSPIGNNTNSFSFPSSPTSPSSSSLSSLSSSPASFSPTSSPSSSSPVSASSSSSSATRVYNFECWTVVETENWVEAMEKARAECISELDKDISAAKGRAFSSVSSSTTPSMSYQ